MVRRVSLNNFGGLEKAALMVLALGASPLLVSHALAQTTPANQPKPIIQVNAISPEFQSIKIDPSRNLSFLGWNSFRQATEHNPNYAKVSTLEETKVPVIEGRRIDYVNWRIDYLRGERGGSGVVEHFFWLPDSFMNTSRGIAEIDLFSYSPQKTLLSVEVIEFNFNQHLGFPNFVNVEDRGLISDYLYKKVDDMPYVIGKAVAKLTKKEVDYIKDLAGFYTWIVNDQTQQKDIWDGNQLIGRPVNRNTTVYYGYGQFLRGKLGDTNIAEMYNEGHVQRAPKLVIIRIKQGELSIEGFKARVILRDYHATNRGTIGQHDAYSDEHTGEKMMQLKVAERIQGLN